MLANCWWRKEIVAILANIFYQHFGVGKPVSDVWTIGKRVGNCRLNQSKRSIHVIYLCDSS